MKETMPPTHAAPTSRWRGVVPRARARVRRLVWLMRNARYQQARVNDTFRDERAAEQLRQAEDGSLWRPPYL
jgi:hypothetical protein